MLLGPVFQADVVTTARQKRYFWLRGLFAALLLFSLWTVYQGVNTYVDEGLSIREASLVASRFFSTFAWISMLLTLIVTPAIAAGAIATERERRTIEYLFATDLSNAEIVLSKLFAKLLLIGKLVLVALPVLAIFRMLGGIPGSLLLTFFAMLASTATLVTIGAMTISVWTPRARDALIRVYLVEAIVFLLPLFLFIFGVGGGMGGPAGGLVARYMQWCLAINPLLVMAFQMSGGGALGVGFGASSVWQLVIIQLLVSAALCFIAVVAVRRVHLGAVSSGGESKKREWALPQFRPHLGDRPMIWKELFARSAGTKLGILGRICVAIILVTMMGIAFYKYIDILYEIYSGTKYMNSYWSPGMEFGGVCISVTVIIGTGAGILMGLRAAGLVTYEKERDCWLSLISTPLTGQEVIVAKSLGNFYAFRWLLVPLGIVWFMQASLSLQFIPCIPFQVVTLATTGLFATAVGLAYSMRFKGSMKAIGATIGTLFFVCGGYTMCCCLPMMAGGGGGEDLMNVVVAGVVPFLHAIPGILAIEEYGDVDSELLVPYVLGNAFYAIVSFVILSTLITSFDQMVGRTGHGLEGPLQNPRTPTLPPAKLPAVEGEGD